MTTEQIILEEFRKDIDNEGLFWRTSRPNTFIDLLMLEASKSSDQGINVSIAIRVVLTSLKAIINDRYGMLDYRLDFKEINKQVLLEKDNILLDIKELIIKHLNSNNTFRDNHFDDLNYLKVLNNLKIDNYSIQIFENTLKSFLIYIEANR